MTMSKNRRLFFILVAVAIVLIVGFFMIRKYNVEKYYTEQRERIELFFHYYYKDITSITFTSVSKNPMDTLVFSGYFNGDEDERFTASIMSHEESFEYHNVISGDFDDKHFRGETYEKLVPVSEILKEQENQNRKK